MAKLLVIGSLQSAVQGRSAYLQWLGTEIVEQGHHLLSGCRNSLDRMVAEGANDWLKANGQDATGRITCYVTDGAEPVHSCGTLLRSRCPNWESLASPGLEVPETVQQADAVIIVGGTNGTECAANWARIAQKPLVPVATFGGSAAQIYDEELRSFTDKYGDRLDRADYELLNQIPSDSRKLARDTVALAARAITSKHVFVAMSFAHDPKFDDAYESIQTVCQEFHYKARRITDAEAIDRIVPEIISGIRKSAFVIVDVSEARPNVYYELGYAQGAGKRVIVTATKGTKLPFDVADIAVIFWEGQKQLKDKLREKIETIASSQGR
jgi:hypothetical protein